METLRRTTETWYGATIFCQDNLRVGGAERSTVELFTCLLLDLGANSFYHTGPAAFAKVNKKGNGSSPFPLWTGSDDDAGYFAFWLAKKSAQVFKSF